MGLFNFFKKKKQPKINFDNVQKIGGLLIVKGYRRLAVANNTSPTSKMSDKKILEIYEEVGTAFRETSEQRNEHIPAGHMNTIVFKFIAIYEMQGEDWYYDHMKYEVNKYLNEGLREDYKQNLRLF